MAPQTPQPSERPGKNRGTPLKPDDARRSWRPSRNPARLSRNGAGQAEEGGEGAHEQAGREREQESTKEDGGRRASPARVAVVPAEMLHPRHEPALHGRPRGAGGRSPRAPKGGGG